MKMLSYLESHKRTALVIGFVLIFVIGLVDYATGYEYAFSLFYVFPISLITWWSSPRIGYIACVVSAAVWFWADTSRGHIYPNALVPYWNTLIRFSFFIIIAYLLSALKSALQRDKELSLTDHLTGASNYRRFQDVVQMELDRLARNPRPFTIAYLDVDDFKAINDTFGHSEGDLVLQTIVGSLKSRTRNTDLVARLGGDELALFFPETDLETAQLILPKIQQVLSNEMTKHNWMVTFSIGVVTCTVAGPTVNDLIKAADNLMYSTKQNGKNRIKYSVYGAAQLID
jgi:diguanylate cyclase (GGDEF)-like protein